MAAPRRLVSIASLAVRLTPSRLSHTRSAAICACPNLRVPALNHTTALTLLSSRAFSTTPASHSASPFRLSSKDKNAPRENDSQEIPEEGYGEEEHIYYSPHQPKREWPPVMSKLSPKHQLRLERKYRRRAALKYARPRWVKATKLAQWGIIIFVMVYSALFMEWGKEDEEQPFKDFRKQFFDTFNSIVSTPQPPGRKIDSKEDK
ncbi:uncharacterized protein TRUGW13939_02806 [Talaromyces rugulosus]|uniref:Uncharacterized protein n=1 Tax=Talaromyces rugulosus TaxID=121627 RepID=A0A7H8QPB9_TALRU|nr:uncharacterized protein TRUGW13939_02806 [Talaromyces rugulosus]QKX55709.1 hypothetical protein TRUGW13939_02806 [Talaromyces rugulosus]